MTGFLLQITVLALWL